MVDSILQFLRANMQIQEEPTRLILLLPIVALVTAVWFLASSINFYKKDRLNLFQLTEKQQLVKLLRNGYLKIFFLSILLSCLAGPLFFSLLFLVLTPAITRVPPETVGWMAMLGRMSATPHRRVQSRTPGGDFSLASASRGPSPARAG